MPELASTDEKSVTKRVCLRMPACSNRSLVADTLEEYKTQENSCPHHAVGLSAVVRGVHAATATDPSGLGAAKSLWGCGT